MTNRTAAQAVEWMRAQDAANATGWNNLCLRASRMSWALPGGWSDAAAWWASCPAEHRRPWSNNPPAGAPVFWRTSTPHDHIAISDGRGNVLGTDLPTRDQIGSVPIGEVRRRWGATEVGWAVWLNGSVLPINEGSTPRPPTNEEDMPITNDEIDRIARAVWELQLRNEAGQVFRARTYQTRAGTAAPIGTWDERVPDAVIPGEDRTARRVLRDIARAVVPVPSSASAANEDVDGEATFADDVAADEDAGAQDYEP